MNIEDLSPQEIQELLELGVIPGKMKDLDKQQELAEALRYSGTPQERHGGRVVVAANPLEHLAATMQGIKAGKQLKAMPGQREALYAQQLAGRKRFLDLLRGGNPATPPINPVSVDDPTAGGY